MKWMEISVFTSHEASEAVADVFHELKVGGVVIEDPLLINNLRKCSAWELCDIPEQADTETVTIKAYIPADEHFTEQMRKIENALNEIEKNAKGSRRGNTCFREICEQDWANAWKQYFHPTRVGENIIIKPSWEVYSQKAGDVIIELDPGMAFGTGTHHTTCLCIKVLEQVMFKGADVIDVGTGSGILAIIAAKLGAKRVRAIDIDAMAVRVATENVALNQVDDTVSAAKGDLLHGIDEPADIIIANIIADIIIAIMPDAYAKLKPGGIFLASGIILEKLDQVTAKAAEVGFEVISIAQQGGWAVLKMSRGDSIA